HAPSRVLPTRRRPPRPTLFPYTTLFRSFPCTAVYRVLAEEGIACDVASGGELAMAVAGGFEPARIWFHGNAKSEAELRFALDHGDRKSTRLNSSHVKISYAVFCLKKKRT